MKRPTVPQESSTLLKEDYGLVPKYLLRFKLDRATSAATKQVRVAAGSHCCAASLVAKGLECSPPSFCCTGSSKPRAGCNTARGRVRSAATAARQCTRRCPCEAAVPAFRDRDTKSGTPLECCRMGACHRRKVPIYHVFCADAPEGRAASTAAGAGPSHRCSLATIHRAGTRRHRPHVLTHNCSAYRANLLCTPCQVRVGKHSLRKGR